MDDKEIQRNFDIVAAHLASMAVNQQKADERQQRADERQRRADERIARLERTLLLAIRAGQRERREWRERHAALVDAQLRTDAALVRLADAQAHTDGRLDALINIVRKERGKNGE